MNKNKNDLEIYHHGIKGQKWGILRYQNKDGTLTALGKLRVKKLREKYEKITGKRLVARRKKKEEKTNTKQDDNSKIKKDIKDMTNEELRSKTERLRLENNYREEKNKYLSNTQTNKKAESFVSKFSKEVLGPVLWDTSKQLVNSKVKQFINDKLQLEGDYRLATNNKKKN